MLPSFISACLALAFAAFVEAQSSNGTQRVWVIKVGSPTNQLVFAPNDIKAQVGDMIQFQFYAMNHSVAASTFDQPCVPIAQSQPPPDMTQTKAFWSGFMPTMSQGQLVYTVPITDTKPIWFYCSQAKHCQGGMVGAINAPTTGNTLAAYKAKAAQAPMNVSPNGTPSGMTGTLGTGSAPPPAAGGLGTTDTTPPPVQATSNVASPLQRSSWGMVGAAVVGFMLL